MHMFMCSIFLKCLFRIKLVGGFNPSEKDLSNWTCSPNTGEHKKKYVKPTPSITTVDDMEAIQRVVTVH